MLLLLCEFSLYSLFLSHKTKSHINMNNWTNCHFVYKSRKINNCAAPHSSPSTYKNTLCILYVYAKRVKKTTGKNIVHSVVGSTNLGYDSHSSQHSQFNRSFTTIKIEESYFVPENLFSSLFFSLLPLLYSAKFHNPRQSNKNTERQEGKDRKYTIFE